MKTETQEKAKQPEKTQESEQAAVPAATPVVESEEAKKLRLAQEAEAGVPQDAVEPGQEGLARVVALACPEGLHEGLLAQVHRVLT